MTKGLGKSAINGYFEELASSHYKQGIEDIEHLWEKYIEVKGDVDKYRYFFLVALCFLVRSGTSGTTLVYENNKSSSVSFPEKKRRGAKLKGNFLNEHRTYATERIKMKLKHVYAVVKFLIDIKLSRITKKMLN